MLSTLIYRHPLQNYGCAHYLVQKQLREQCLLIVQMEQPQENLTAKLDWLLTIYGGFLLIQIFGTNPGTLLSTKLFLVGLAATKHGPESEDFKHQRDSLSDRLPMPKKSCHRNSFKCGNQYNMCRYVMQIFSCYLSHFPSCYIYGINFTDLFIFPHIWSHFLAPPLSYDDPHSCLNTTTFLSH